MECKGERADSEDPEYPGKVLLDRAKGHSTWSNSDKGGPWGKHPAYLCAIQLRQTPCLGLGPFDLCSHRLPHELLFLVINIDQR